MLILFTTPQLKDFSDSEALLCTIVDLIVQKEKSLSRNCIWGKSTFFILKALLPYSATNSCGQQTHFWFRAFKTAQPVRWLWEGYGMKQALTTIKLYYVHLDTKTMPWTLRSEEWRFWREWTHGLGPRVSISWSQINLMFGRVCRGDRIPCLMAAVSSTLFNASME